jgi:hypothetical protein
VYFVSFFYVLIMLNRGHFLCWCWLSDLTRWTALCVICSPQRRDRKIYSVSESCMPAEHRVFSQIQQTHCPTRPCRGLTKWETYVSRTVAGHKWRKRFLTRSPIFCVRLPFAARDVQMICGEEDPVAILTFPAHPRDGPGKGSPANCKHLIKPRSYLILVSTFWDCWR